MRGAEAGFPGDVPAAPPDFDLLPLSARVADRLSTILLLSHELLGDLATGNPGANARLRDVVQAVYDDVNTLMGRLAQ